MDLTVVTVCYNALSLLRGCVDSIAPLLSAPDLAVEYLVIDGASTDGTPEYLRAQAAEGRVSRWVSEPDAGIYDAMNKGLRLARGRVCVFINADDRICAEAVARCSRPILEGRARFVMASVELMGEDGRSLEIRRPDLRFALLHACCSHQSFYCETALLRELGGFDAEHFPVVADAAVMTQLMARRCRFEVADVVASRFTLGGVSSSPLLYRDHLRLLVRNREALLEEVRQRPAFASLVLRFLRRSWVRWLTRGEGRLEPELQQGLESLTKGIFAALTPRLRAARRRALRRRAALAALLALFPGKKRRAKALAERFVCRALADGATGQPS